MTTTVLAYIPSPAQGVWQLGPVPLRAYALFIIAGIIAESQSSNEVLDLLYEKFLKERVTPLYEKVEEGINNGEFRSDIDIEIALDILVGPLFMRVLSGEHGMDNNFAENYPTQAVNALLA